MIGYHAVPVIADAYLKGIRGYSADDALDAMVASATNPRYAGLDQYMKLGWVAVGQGTRRRIENARVRVRRLDHRARWRAPWAAQDVAARFNERAGYWRNVFDRKTGFVRARKSDGTFREPFDPAAAGYYGDYTEGNAWQYTWYTPQDTAGLIRAMGGERSFVAQARCAVRCEGRSGELRARRRHLRAHRPLRARQRAEPSHRVSLRVCRASRGARRNA